MSADKSNSASAANKPGRTGPGTRSTTGAQSASGSSPSSAAAGNAAASSSLAPDEPSGDEEELPAAGEGEQMDVADTRALLASMMEEMRAMREETARLRSAQAHAAAASSAAACATDPSLSLAPQRQPSPGTTASEIATLARILQDNQAQQAEQLRQQQAASAAQMLLLQTLGELPTFGGKGSDTTLAANEWLQRAEDYFAVREQALGIDAALGDKARLLNAVNALVDDARRWYTALPQRPTTWATFIDVIRSRFCSVPDERIRVDKLHELVEKGVRFRDRLNVQGMQVFTARFAQLAGEVPDEYVTQHGKFALLARALPQCYAEVVLKEDAKQPLPSLNEVINMVLSRAAHKEHAAAYGGSSSSSSSASAAPMNLDAVTLAAATFGWSQEEARLHTLDSEGWAPHDTSDSQPSSSAAAASSTGAFGSQSRTPKEDPFERFERSIAALAARIGSGPDNRDRSNNSRRNVPRGILKEIPAALADSRRAAGLCIKCGIVKYEGGSKGHNAGTCKGPVDTTTSAADGKKKVNF